MLTSQQLPVVERVEGTGECESMTAGLWAESENNGSLPPHYLAVMENVTEISITIVALQSASTVELDQGKHQLQSITRHGGGCNRIYRGGLFGSIWINLQKKKKKEKALLGHHFL